MTINFAWVNGDESFNPAVHCREDEQVFKLEIRQREGGFALARATIRNPGCGLLGAGRKRYCLISDDQELLFRGRVVGMPASVEGQAVCLDFTAEPMDSQRQLHDLQNDLKQAPHWDDLFVEEGARDNPTEALEARSELYYWSRATGKVHLSDIFQGNEHIDLGDNFFKDSLKVAVGEAPLDSVSMEVIAEWHQRAEGECDISHLIAEKFQYGLVNTLTGPDLAQKWWRTGERVGRTGYWVTHSELKEIRLPRLSASSYIWEKSKTGDRHKVRLKRHWFKASTRLGWAYRQKRCEIAKFTLKHATQSLAQHNRRCRRLRLHLQDIVGENHHWRPHHRYTPRFQVVYQGVVYACIRRHQSGENFDEQQWQKLRTAGHVSDQASRASFFLTDRGKQAVEHAIEVARAHLASSARAITIRVTADFASLRKVTTDHLVSITDPRLPGGKAQGKVTDYRIVMDGKTGKRWVDVTLSVAVGAGPQDEQLNISTGESYAEATFCDDYQLEVGRGRTSGNIGYVSWQAQQPNTGILNPHSLSAHDVVHKINVVNSVVEQDEYLLQNQYPERQKVREVIAEVPTNISIELADICAVETLNHEITIDLPEPWSAPKQIDLYAE